MDKKKKKEITVFLKKGGFIPHTYWHIHMKQSAKVSNMFELHAWRNAKVQYMWFPKGKKEMW